MTSRSASEKGSGFRRTAFTTLKMALLAPIPRARVAIATRLNPGACRSRRKP